MESDENEQIPFWFREQSGATEEDLRLVEEHVGHRLPNTLREMLKTSNGGVCNYSLFENGETPLSVLPFLSADRATSMESFYSAFEVGPDFGVPDGVVVFAAMGDAWWGLDYRHDGPEPQVVYCDAPELGHVFAAATFDNFIQGLVE